MDKTKPRGYNIYDIVAVLNILKEKIAPQRSKEFIDGMGFATGMVSIAIRNSTHVNQHLLNKKLNEDLEELSYQYVELQRTSSSKIKELQEKIDLLLCGDKEIAIETFKSKQRRRMYNLAFSTEFTPSEVVKRLRDITMNWQNV